MARSDNWAGSTIGVVAKADEKLLPPPKELREFIKLLVVALALGEGKVDMRVRKPNESEPLEDAPGAPFRSEGKFERFSPARRAEKFLSRSSCFFKLCEFSLSD